MPNVEFTNLFAVVLIALLAPLLLGLAPLLRVPAVVLEIVVGIVVGPHDLGLVAMDSPLLTNLEKHGSLVRCRFRHARPSTPAVGERESGGQPTEPQHRDCPEQWPDGERH